MAPLTSSARDTSSRRLRCGVSTIGRRGVGTGEENENEVGSAVRRDRWVALGMLVVVAGIGGWAAHGLRVET